MHKFFNRAAFFSVFLDNLYLPINFGFDFRLNYILFIVFIGYYLITLKKVKIDVSTLISTGIISFILLLVSIFNGDSIVSFFKQFILVFINFVFCYLYLSSNQFNWSKVLKDYLVVVKVICVVSIIQFISFKIGFVYGADYSYLGFDLGNFSFYSFHRVQAWFQEPSFLVYAIMPAAHIALSRFFGIHKQIDKTFSFFILLVLFLSGSSTGFIGLLLSLIIIIFSKYPILKRPLYLSLIILIIPLLTYVLYQLPDVKQRVDDSVALFVKKDPTKEDIDNTNLSTYALYSNFRVTLESLSNNPIFGTGFGTYEFNYDKYINLVIPESNFRSNYQLNKKDANSLFFRIVVEFGFFGLFFFLLFIYNKRIRFNTLTSELGILWALNNGIVILVILRLLRQGHYTSLGFILFLLLLFYSKKNVIYNE